jgi:hypothetical protein
MNFCPGRKNSIIGKTPEKTGRYDRIINELCHLHKIWQNYQWIMSLTQDTTELSMNYVTYTRYDRIINELCHFYKVSLIKTGLVVSCVSDIIHW